MIFEDLLGITSFGLRIFDSLKMAFPPGVNPQAEIIKKISKDANDYVKARNQLKDKIFIVNNGEMAMQDNTAKLFKPVTESQKTTNDALLKIVERQEKKDKAIEDDKAKALEDSKKMLEYKSNLPKELIDEINEIVTNTPSVSTQTNNTLKFMTSDDVTGIRYYRLGRDNNKHHLFAFKDGVLLDRKSHQHFEIPTLGIAKLLFENDPSDSEITPEDVKDYQKFLNDYGFKDVRGNKAKLVKRIKSQSPTPIVEEFEEDIPSTSSGTSRISADKLPEVLEYLRGIPKKGKGLNVQYLPSSSKLLFQRLNVLLGSQSAGNNNARNEAISIMDNLLSRNLITKQKYEEMFKVLTP